MPTVEPENHIQEQSTSEPLLPQDSPTHGECSPLYFQKAAALVSQVALGHHMPLEIIEHEDYESAKRAFLFYSHLSSIRILVMIVLNVLPFFQEPIWYKRQKSLNYEDLSKFPVSGIQYMSTSVFLVIQMLCFIPLIWSTILEYKFRGFNTWKHKVFIYKVCVLSGMAFGMLQTTVGIFDIGLLEAFNVSTYAHLFVSLIFQRTLRRAFFMALKMVRHFMDIAVLVILFVLLSALIATSAFDGYSSYKNFQTSLLNLFILLTTSNSPDVWVPV